MSYVNTADFSYRKLPIYYLTPLEVVCLARGIGEKKWAKCQEAGRTRLDPEVSALAYGAEIRVALRPPKDMRPPEAWLHEAKISDDTLRDTLKLVKS